MKSVKNYFKVAIVFGCLIMSNLSNSACADTVYSDVNQQYQVQTYFLPALAPWLIRGAVVLVGLFLKRCTEQLATRTGDAIGDAAYGRR